MDAYVIKMFHNVHNTHMYIIPHMRLVAIFFWNDLKEIEMFKWENEGMRETEREENASVSMWKSRTLVKRLSKGGGDLLSLS